MTVNGRVESAMAQIGWLEEQFSLNGVFSNPIPYLQGGKINFKDYDPNDNQVSDNISTTAELVLEKFREIGKAFESIQFEFAKARVVGKSLFEKMPILIEISNYFEINSRHYKEYNYSYALAKEITVIQGCVAPLQFTSVLVELKKLRVSLESENKRASEKMGHIRDHYLAGNPDSHLLEKTITKIIRELNHHRTVMEQVLGGLAQLDKQIPALKYDPLKGHDQLRNELKEELEAISDEFEKIYDALTFSIEECQNSIEHNFSVEDHSLELHNLSENVEDATSLFTEAILDGIEEVEFLFKTKQKIGLDKTNKNMKVTCLLACAYLKKYQEDYIDYLEQEADPSVPVLTDPEFSLAENTLIEVAKDPDLAPYLSSGLFEDVLFFDSKFWILKNIKLYSLKGVLKTANLIIYYKMKLAEMRELIGVRPFEKWEKNEELKFALDNVSGALINPVNGSTIAYKTGAEYPFSLIAAIDCKILGPFTELETGKLRSCLI